MAVNVRVCFFGSSRNPGRPSPEGHGCIEGESGPQCPQDADIGHGEAGVWWVAILQQGGYGGFLASPTIRRSRSWEARGQTNAEAGKQEATGGPDGWKRGGAFERAESWRSRCAPQKVPTVWRARSRRIGCKGQGGSEDRWDGVATAGESHRMNLEVPHLDHAEQGVCRTPSLPSSMSVACR